MRLRFAVLALFVLETALFAQDPAQYIRENYTKREVQIAMRDGVKLFAAIYSPKDTSKSYPILLNRTPYSVGPYGDALREHLGPSDLFPFEGYHFVHEDVRGCFQSEGEFVNMRPQLDHKQGPKDIDESSDTWDTIEWLVKNVAGNNGRVGMYGISYPGFYSAAGMIDAHPALKAVSPQAPIADWFWDDFRHHGTIWLPHAFNFLADFGRVRSGPTKDWPEDFEHGTPDGYQFFLQLGSLASADLRYFHGTIPFWKELIDHPNYDSFWQARNLRPHLNHVAPAVLVVGGWFDAEDLFGALKIYRAVEQQNPDVFNALVMGPWFHGGWARGDGDHLGNISFGGKQSLFYREQIELPFFEHHLRGEKKPEIAEASVFETGANRWRTFAQWPPAGTTTKSLYVRAGGQLAWDPPLDAGNGGDADSAGLDSYVSDPAHPVPFTEDVAIGMTREYMTDDQRFASRRPDVLTYRTDPLGEDLTLAGPIETDLWVSLTGSDADFVVKLIDEFPPDAPDWNGIESDQHMGGYQMLVRSEAIRGRFRESYENPQPFVRDQPSLVDLELLDVLHTFQKGHRIEVQIQSTWFPLMDRNPQTYVPNVSYARDSDFVPATIRVLRSQEHATHLTVGVLAADVGQAAR